MITVIQLKNWRAYRTFELKLNPGTTFLVAKNGVGKTSLIDAVRWALDPQLSARSDMLHGSADSGSVKVELVVGTHSVQIERSLIKGRSKVPKSEMIAWIDGERTLDIGDIYRLFEAEWGTEYGFLTRVSFITDRLLYSDEEPDLRSHLSDVFGLKNLQQTIKELGPAILKSERAIKTERADVSATESDLSKAEAELQQSTLALNGAMTVEQIKREEADNARELVREAERVKTSAAELKSWHESRAQIANAAQPIIGQTTPDIDLRDILEASERTIKDQISKEREHLAVLSNRIQSIEIELARLLNAEADCPVCRRPLDDQSRGIAESQHQFDLETAREAMTSIDLESPVALEAQVRELLRRAVELGDAPLQYHSPSGDLADLKARSDMAREAYELAVADVREFKILHIAATKARDDIQDSLADLTKISLLRGPWSGRVGRVAADGVVEVEAELVGQRCQPGQHVAQFVELLGRGALADGLGQLAQLFGQPGHGGRDAPLAVGRSVEALHQILHFPQLHDGDATTAQPPVDPGPEVRCRPRPGRAGRTGPSRGCAAARWRLGG